MTLTIAPNEFTQPDYSVFNTARDGRKLEVGRIFKAPDGTAKETPWFWSVVFQQRDGRAAPHQGYVDDFETAEAEWKRCWESADAPIEWPPALRIKS